MKKELITLTALMLASSLAAGCGSGTADKETDAPDTDKTTPEAESVTSADYIYPTADYGGFEFTFLNIEPEIWANVMIAPEEMSGDLVSDAMFERNSRIEDRYNVVISDRQVGINDVANELKKTVTAGEDVYSAAMISAHTMSGLLGDNYLCDLKGLDGLNLDKPWWDQMVNESADIMGHLYFTTSDICLFPFEATVVLFMNEKTMTDVGLELPYDLVRQGKWTVDRLAEYGKAGATLNGDESYLPIAADGSCRYGFGTHFGMIDAFIYGSGGRFAWIEDGKPVFGADSEKMYGIYEKVGALASTDGCVLCFEKADGMSDLDAFLRGRAMICSETLGCISNLRDMKDDYGVIPVPKYDEAQEDYISLLANWGTTLMVVPSSVSDLSRTATILDAMAYDSHISLMEPYYNAYLMQKGTRNDDSAEMLGIISRTRTLASDVILGWTSDIETALINTLNTGDTAVASKIAALKDKSIAKIEKDIEKYE